MNSTRNTSLHGFVDGERDEHEKTPSSTFSFDRNIQQQKIE